MLREKDEIKNLERKRRRKKEIIRI